MNPLRTETSLFVAWTNICAWSSICALPWIVPPFPISPFNYWESEKEYPFCKTVRFLKTKDSFMYTHLSGRVRVGSNRNLVCFCQPEPGPTQPSGWIFLPEPDHARSNTWLGQTRFFAYKFRVGSGFGSKKFGLHPARVLRRVENFSLSPTHMLIGLVGSGLSGRAAHDQV